MENETAYALKSQKPKNRKESNNLTSQKREHTALTYKLQLAQAINMRPSSVEKVVTLNSEKYR